jgi:hypothetical protein
MLQDRPKEELPQHMKMAMEYLLNNYPSYNCLVVMWDKNEHDNANTQMMHNMNDEAKLILLEDLVTAQKIKMQQKNN